MDYLTQYEKFLGVCVIGPLFMIYLYTTGTFCRGINTEWTVLTAKI